MAEFTIDMAESACCGVCTLTALSATCTNGGGCACTPGVNYAASLQAYTRSVVGSLQTPKPSWARGSSISFTADGWVECGGHWYVLVGWSATFGCDGGGSDSGTTPLIDLDLPETCDCGETCTIAISLDYEKDETCAINCGNLQLSASVSPPDTSLDDDCDGMPFSTQVRVVAAAAVDAVPKRGMMYTTPSAGVCRFSTIANTNQEYDDGTWHMNLFGEAQWEASVLWSYSWDGGGTKQVTASCTVEASWGNHGGAFNLDTSSGFCTALNLERGSDSDTSKATPSVIGVADNNCEILQLLRTFLSGAYSIALGTGGTLGITIDAGGP